MILTALAVFVVSAAALGMELVLIRTLSIGHWHHFSYLVISTALLGFAASGTLITLAQRLFRRSWRLVFWLFALGFAISAPAVFWLSQRVPLDEIQLLWDWRQPGYLFLYYLLYFVPFFCAGSCVVLALTVWAKAVGRMYFFNLLGSGLGAAGFLGLMYVCSPERLLLVVSGMGFLAAAIVCLRVSRPRLVATVVLAAGTLLVFTLALPLTIQLSDYKQLVFYSGLPEAEVLAQRHGPLARIDVLKAKGIRSLPGPSLAFTGTVPEQLLIISDADGTSAINRFKNLDELRCYAYVGSALPYRLIEKPRVCVIGAGGGSDVCQALVLGAAAVTAIELNPQVVKLVAEDFADFAGNIYSRPDVEVLVADGRSFLERTPQRFDIIQISLLDSLSSSAAGVYALNQSNLYTIEAVGRMLDTLRPGGFLCITRWLKVPARDGIKMLATVAEALRRRGAGKPGRHVAMIRSMVTCTIIVSPQPLSQAHIDSVREFSEERWFDLVWLPDIQPAEANRFNILSRALYHEAASEIFAGNHEALYRNYAYNIRPATDDRPYFFDFFRWRTLPRLIRMMRHERQRWLPFAEWGYLVLTASLAQAVIASAALILLPLGFLKRRQASSGTRAATLLYFSMLGLGYIFLEMGFIQKLTLIIGDPVTAVAVTIAGFLVFSGLGSLSAGRIFKTARATVLSAVAAIVIIGIWELALLHVAFDALMGLSRQSRILVSLAMIAPLAFFMGMPFPSGLGLLA
ncbi:MAG: SAM-dependent methyltransferase, partial [Planctomycetia bacterium]|nr:SAM-dependent methyltransferase [Planctomycetia bacterium]